MPLSHRPPAARAIKQWGVSSAADLRISTSPGARRAGRRRGWGRGYGEMDMASHGMKRAQPDELVPGPCA
jgi:hypothetical protein